MRKTVSPRIDPVRDLAGPLLVIGLVAVPAAGVSIIWLAGHLASWCSGHGWTGPALNGRFARELLRHGWEGFWPDTDPQLIGFLAFLLAVLALMPLVAIAVSLLTRSPSELGRHSQHRQRDLRDLSPRRAAARAIRLRPSLSSGRGHDPAEHGIVLGKLDPRGPVVRASWEDVGLAIMAPRTGKTTGLAVQAILDAPGPAIGTSNKADLYLATSTLRAQRTGQQAWVFDPQQVVFAPRDWWWNPLAAATDVDGAHRLAEHFIQTVRGRRDRDFWTAAGVDLLTSLFLAASSAHLTLSTVDDWLNDPSLSTPAEILTAHGHHSSARSLVGRQNGAPETRDGIYETARTAAQCLRNPAIMSWVTPPAGALPRFDPDAFVTSRQTLHLLSKDGAGSAAPLVAALTDQILRAGVRAAERCGGRLDPPMTVILDEAANICPIPDLPDLYSHLGSRGIVPITMLQSYRQGARVWGEAGMDTLWSASTIKLIGAGLDDPKLAGELSRMIGDHDVEIRSRSHGHSYQQHSTNTSLRRQPILPPEELRAMPRNTALLFATGARPARLKLLPWYESPRATDIARALQTAQAELARRARDAAGGTS